ncbi:MAG TPA: efflux RND transporter periplasmic adaptor subunit [Planctomycetota bacterium]|nr:efflux RND transporter periplasmic adaptor subunit [Planctomycetota bacterium]
MSRSHTTRVVMPAFAFGVLLAMTVGCGAGSGKKAKPGPGDGKDAELPPVPVAVETVGRAEVRRTLILSGSVRPQSQVRIFTKIAGRIEELGADTCDEVVKDKVVAVLDRKLLDAQFKQARAALALAEVSLADASRDWTRAEGLFKQGAINEQARDKALAARDLAAAQQAQAEAAVAGAQAGLDETRIAATLTGTVTSRGFDQGDFVSPGQPLFTVQDLRTVKVLASVPQADLPLLVPGQTRARVTVEGVDGAFDDALVAKVEPALDPATLSAPIELSVRNRRRAMPAGASAGGRTCTPPWVLVSGMSARIELVIEERKDAPVLPLSAVRNDGKRDFVFVVTDAGAAERKDVRLGKLGAPRGELGWLVELREPQDLVGRKVVTEGVTRLTDGSRVQVTAGEAGPVEGAGRAPADKGAAVEPAKPGAASGERRP